MSWDTMSNILKKCAPESAERRFLVILARTVFWDFCVCCVFLPSLAALMGKGRSLELDSLGANAVTSFSHCSMALYTLAAEKKPK